MQVCFLYILGNSGGLNKPSQLRMEDITMPQGNISSFPSVNCFWSVLNFHPASHRQHSESLIRRPVNPEASCWH